MSPINVAGRQNKMTRESASARFPINPLKTLLQVANIEWQLFRRRMNMTHNTDRLPMRPRKNTIKYATHSATVHTVGYRQLEESSSSSSISASSVIFKVSSVSGFGIGLLTSSLLFTTKALSKILNCLEVFTSTNRDQLDDSTKGIRIFQENNFI